MPLFLADCHQELEIIRITGNDKLKTHLKNIGFIDGQVIIIVNKIDKNLIIKVKDVSVALSHELAKRIYIRRK